MDTKTKIYRFKFSPKFLEHLKEFSRIHRFDTAGAFKDNWEIWCDENKDIIEEESNKLKEKGYCGNKVIRPQKESITKINSNDRSMSRIIDKAIGDISNYIDNQ